MEEGENSSSSSKRTKKEDEQWRWWEEMSPEVLALIFVRLPSADFLLRTVPFVCRAWRDVVAGPYCWTHIDIEQWCRRVCSVNAVDAAVTDLVRRSAGSMRMLCAYKLGDDGFEVASSSGKLLNVLKIPMSEVTDKMLVKNVGALQFLTILDISYCLEITHKGMEVIGKTCKFLVELRRNMPPPQPEFINQDNGAASKVDESEAMAVANTMPFVEHLELAYGRFSDHGLDAILTMCVSLRILDIRGCWNVRLGGHLDGRCDLLPSFKDPWYDQFDYDLPSGDEGENVDEGVDADEDQALAAAIAAADAADHAAAAAADGGAGGGGGPVEMVVVSDDGEDAGVAYSEDDWAVDSDDSWWETG